MQMVQGKVNFTEFLDFFQKKLKKKILDIFFFLQHTIYGSEWSAECVGFTIGKRYIRLMMCVFILFLGMCTLFRLQGLFEYLTSKVISSSKLDAFERLFFKNSLFEILQKKKKKRQIPLKKTRKFMKQQFSGKLILVFC